jgi:hypothetical protein
MSFETVLPRLCFDVAVLCDPHVACTAPLLLCPRHAASVHFPGTIVSRDELTVLFSCLCALCLWHSLPRCPSVCPAMSDDETVALGRAEVLNAKARRGAASSSLCCSLPVDVQCMLVAVACVHIAAPPVLDNLNCAR